MTPSRFCCLVHMGWFALRIVFVRSLHWSWECFKRQSIIIQLRLLLFYTCKANVEVAVRELFSVRGKISVTMLSNELSISGSNFLREQTLVNTSKAEFVDFGLDFGDLFHTLLCWKRKLLNNLNCNLVTLGGIKIFPPTKRQAASEWNTNRLLPEVVSNFIRFITDTFIGLLRIDIKLTINVAFTVRYQRDPDLNKSGEQYSHVRVGVLATWRISDMFWRLLRRFLCGKGERKN